MKRLGIMIRYVLAAVVALSLFSCNFGSGCNGSQDVAAADSLYKTVYVDSMKVTWIKDNAGDKLMPRSLFVSAPDSVFEQLSLQNGVPSSISMFLLEKDGKKILFDTGMGAYDSGLVPGLAALGLEPSDITHLYLTHFHADHIGGMISGDSAVFANAEVYASKKEYEAWMAMPAEQNALVVKIMGLYEPRLHLFDFGEVLPGDVETISATGHTPGHTVFRSGKLLVIGDLMHGAALQVPYPEYCAEYDMNKDEAIATRMRIMQYAKDNDLTVVGMHLPAPGFLR